MKIRFVNSVLNLIKKEFNYEFKLWVDKEVKSLLTPSQKRAKLRTYHKPIRS